MNSKFRVRNLPYRPGYTLLEVLLALGLTVVIFAAIASGIRLHLVSIARAQTQIEQRQVARNLLVTIGNDIRAAVLYRAADYSGLENINATQQLQIQQAIGFAASDDSSSNSDVEGDNNDDGIEDIVQEEDVSYRPVLEGSQQSISFDISRLPRLDQYLSFGSDGSEAIPSTPSDIKSIGYFFSDAAATNEPIRESSSVASGGLYRREMDRAVASFRGLSGSRTTPDETSKLLAPEVSSLRFRYYDGSDWSLDWDFDEREGLPMAVEVTLTLDPARTTPANFRDSLPSEQASFRSVVHLPLAEPTEPDDE